MELIPILSTIILVATICTFVLAIGAYILYKIRERRGEQSEYPPPSSIHAELVTPEETEAPEEPPYVKTVPKSRDQSVSKEHGGLKPAQYTSTKDAAEYKRSTKEKTTGKKFLKYTSEGYIPTEEDKNTGVLKWR